MQRLLRWPLRSRCPGPGQSAAVLDAVVVRAPDAYPVYDSTDADHLAVMRGSWIPPICTRSAGMACTIPTTGSFDVRGHAHLANLHGESHDVWSVNTDLEYHELQRMHDERRNRRKQSSTRSCAPSRLATPKARYRIVTHSMESPRGCWSIASPHEAHRWRAGTAPQSRLKRARRGRRPKAVAIVSSAAFPEPASSYVEPTALQQFAKCAPDDASSSTTRILAIVPQSVRVSGGRVGATREN